MAVSFLPSRGLGSGDFGVRDHGEGNLHQLSHLAIPITHFKTRVREYDPEQASGKCLIVHR